MNLKTLITLANELDKRGLLKEADFVDRLIKVAERAWPMTLPDSAPIADRANRTYEQFRALLLEWQDCMVNKQGLSRQEAEVASKAKHVELMSEVENRSWRDELELNSYLFHEIAKIVRPLGDCRPQEEIDRAEEEDRIAYEAHLAEERRSLEAETRPKGIGRAVALPVRKNPHTGEQQTIGNFGEAFWEQDRDEYFRTPMVDPLAE